MTFSKLNKQLNAAITELGITEPNTLQSSVLSKINSGADLYITSAEKTGKTSTVLISLIHNLKYAFEDAPRALIIVSDKEKALETLEQFKQLAKNTDLRCVPVFEEAPLLKHFEDVYYGADIVVGTAKRVMDIYFKYNLNINKLKHFVIDDAENIVKNNLQGHIDRLTESLPKCQRIVITSTVNPKVEKLSDKFLKNPHIIEIES